MAVRGRFMGNNGFGIAGRSYRILGVVHLPGWCASRWKRVTGQGVF